MKNRLFGPYSMVFLTLTVCLVLYKYVYIVGFDDFTTALICLGAVFLLAKVSRGAFCLRNTGRRMTFEVFLCLLGLMFFTQLLASGVYAGFEQGLNHAGYTMYGAPPTAQLRQLIPEGVFALPNALYPILLGPIFEEMVYRGYAAKNFERNGGRLAAILLSGVAFAIGHGDLAYTIHTLFAGMIFGWVLVEYGIKWACILHCLNNFVLVGSDMLLYALLGDGAGAAASNGLSVLLGIVAAVICLRRRGGIKAYLQNNRTEKGTYPRAFLNLGFLLFLLFNIWKASGHILPL